MYNKNDHRYSYAEEQIRNMTYLHLTSTQLFPLKTNINIKDLGSTVLN
jgi:hypothetical protein